jgi:hypothetical protein
MSGNRESFSMDNIKLTARDWQLLLTTAQAVVYKKNRPIIQEGTMNHFLYRLKEGKVRVEKLSVSIPGEEYTLLGKPPESKSRSR